MRGLPNTANTVGYAILLLALGSPGPVRSQTVPNAFTGTWIGRVVVADQALCEARVRIEPGSIGNLVGKVDYPDYDCGGNLILVEERGWQIVVREQLTYGMDNCIDNGRIVFSKPDENPAIMFEWTGSGLRATGVLEKRDG